MLGVVTEWSELAAALAVFVLTHAIPARPALRGRLVAVMGRRAYLIGYSVVSLVVLGWLISAAARAPYVELWPREDWQSWVPVLGMAGACVLAVFALTMPNPLSLGARWAGKFDPDHPGIAGFVRHPILWATLVWSLSHVLANGDLSHVLMFGFFAALSVGGMAMLDRRLRRKLGEAQWRTLARKTSNLPMASLARCWRPRISGGVVLRLARALALYAILFAGHSFFTGIPIVLPARALCDGAKTAPRATDSAWPLIRAARP